MNLPPFPLRTPMLRPLAAALALTLSTAAAAAGPAPRTVELNLAAATKPMDRFFAHSVGADYPGTTGSAENLAQQNRLHQDLRCDGKLYPWVNAEGIPNGISTSCTVVDARTVTYKLIRETAQGREGEGTWTLSSDGTHSTTVTVWEDHDGNKGQANERRFTRNSENCLNHAQDELFRECQRRSRPPRE